MATARERGNAKETVEAVSVPALNRELPMACGRFVYLGTMVTPKARTAEELKRRIQKAWGVVGTMKSVWRKGELFCKTKGKLFSAFVTSVLLYNAEVWPLNKGNIDILEQAYYGMARRVACHARPKLFVETGWRVERQQVLDVLGLPTLEGLMSQKRLRWVGHTMRRGVDDLSCATVLEELEKTHKVWTKLVFEDAQKIGIETVAVLQQAAQSRSSFYKITKACTLSHE